MYISLLAVYNYKTKYCFLLNEWTFISTVGKLQHDKFSEIGYARNIVKWGNYIQSCQFCEFCILLYYAQQSNIITVEVRLSSPIILVYKIRKLRNFTKAIMLFLTTVPMNFPNSKVCLMRGKVH